MTMTDLAYQLNEAFADLPKVFPRILCASLRKGDAELLKTVGVPVEFADWFRSLDSITEAVNVAGVTFEFDGGKHIIQHACTIGKQDLGNVVIDSQTGAIVFIKDDRTATFVNSSLYQLLFCIVNFLQSSSHRFTDVESRMMKCKENDPAAFHDINGPWNVLFEEAIAGMF
jgi:hypothetical protein